MPSDVALTQQNLGIMYGYDRDIP
ncbi:uncharacterized protein METZ01_LOCUS242419 [marine metagenome]|uniref:Uncharacterized protein n=1 Tax=marine metagenome TaxID=408172 RepID=A0A382HR97_9ZZZZ